MRFELHLLLLAFYNIVSASEPDKSTCYIICDEEVACRHVELNKEKPITTEKMECYLVRNQTNRAIVRIELAHVTGSIGIKTLSPFQEGDELIINYPNVSSIEKGALCSLPKLKLLRFTHNAFPMLTKEHLSGCNNLEQFEVDVPLSEDALEEMIGLIDISIGFNTEYYKTSLAHLKRLNYFDLKIKSFDNEEAGFLCPQPTLNQLSIASKKFVELNKSLFDGCDNLKNIWIQQKARIPEGQYPFSNMTNLEELKLNEGVTHQLTKDFLQGLPNLKLLLLEGKRITKLIVDKDAFEGAPKIRDLTLTTDSLEDRDLEALHVLKHLKKLDLSHNTIQDPNSLPSLPKLEILFIPYNVINKFDFVAFKKKFPSLKWLDMMQNALDSAFEEELSNENDIVIRTRYEHSFINKNQSLETLYEYYSNSEFDFVHDY